MVISFLVYALACGGKNLDTADIVDTADTNTVTDTIDTTDTTDSNDTTDTSGASQEDLDHDGYSQQDGDCDDTDPNIHPNAIDYPGDSMDEDCVGGAMSIVPVQGGLANPSFDAHTNGVPTDWSKLPVSPVALAWQGNGDTVFTINGDTGEAFTTHGGDGSLKLWGDYDSNPLSPGESSVYQQFFKNASWSPANKQFWVDAWVYMHHADPLLATATVHTVFRCFSEYQGSWSLVSESYSDAVNSASPQDTWFRIHNTVTCDANSTIVQVLFVFGQQDTNTDHGVLYIDDVQFGEIVTQ